MLKLLPKNLKDNIKRSQNNIKYHNIIPNNKKIIPKITKLNIKPMLKEFKRITKMY